MEYQLGRSLESSGALSVLPYISLAVFKIGAGILSDRMIKSWRYSLPFTRKLMSAISTFGPAVALACVPTTTNPDVTIALFAAAMATSGFQISGSDLALADLFSEHMGAVCECTHGGACASKIPERLLYLLNEDWSVCGVGLSMHVHS